MHSEFFVFGVFYIFGQSIGLVVYLCAALNLLRSFEWVLFCGHKKTLSKSRLVRPAVGKLVDFNGNYPQVTRLT